MAQKLKAKNINVVPGQLFCCQSKPNKWSQMYCSEYFNVFEYLV